MPRRPLAALLAVLLLAGTALAACTDDDPGTTPTTRDATTTSGPADTTEPTEVDEGLRAVMLGLEDLPEGFTEGGEVDDTITAFCATEDAAAGLQASAREVRGFAREGGGASVIQLAFRFRDDDAATFVAQADGALTRCSGVPDGSGTGLAFAYEPLAPAVEATVAVAGEARTGRFGTSAGSGNLTLDVVVLHQGDVGVLVAVLGLSLPRAELDALAAATFTAVVAKL